MPWEDVFIVSQAGVVSGEPSGELVYPESKAGAGSTTTGRALTGPETSAAGQRHGL